MSMTHKWKENSCFQLSQVTKNNFYECVDMFVFCKVSIPIGYTVETRDVPIPKFEPIPVPIPILNFKAKPILNRYRYLDFSVLKFIYTPFYSKGDTSRTGHS